MQSLISWFMAHQILGTMAAGAIWNSYVGSLDAPTAKSSPYYRFLFKFSNALAFNFQRARSTSIENSPNFEAAVKKYVAEQGDQPKPSADVVNTFNAPHL